MKCLTQSTPFERHCSHPTLTQAHCLSRAESPGFSITQSSAWPKALHVANTQSLFEQREGRARSHQGGITVQCSESN